MKYDINMMKYERKKAQVAEIKKTHLKNVLKFLFRSELRKKYNGKDRSDGRSDRDDKKTRSDRSELEDLMQMQKMTKPSYVKHV